MSQVEWERKMKYPVSPAYALVVAGYDSKIITAVLKDHKQWILAVASGRVDHVALLVQAGLTHMHTHSAV